jgi:8-oxo-dGTP diphosphatase
MRQSTDLIFEYEDIYWAPKPNRARLWATTTLPEMALVTSVHTFCFKGDSLMMVNHERRGWDIPGGHIEAGEAAEQAAARELFEEAAVVASDYSLFATLELELLCPKPTVSERKEYPYPKSYLCFFTAKLDAMRAFPAEFETTDRAFLSPTEIRSLPWYVEHQPIYRAACRAAGVPYEE